MPTIGRDDDLSASWGPYLAQLRRTNPPAVVIRDATHVVQRVTLPRHTYADVHLSGRRLLVASSGAAYVVDLLTGHRTLVPEAHALWGDRIAYVKHGGEVRVRDVVTGHETVIRRAGGYTGAVREATLAMWGDWVTYSLPTSSGGVLDMTAVNVVSGKRVRIHGTGSSWNFVGVFTVSDGYVAWVEGHTGAVHLVRLSDGTDRVVGNIVHGYDGAWIGLTDEFITWVDRDARTHVLTIPNLSAAPRAVGTYSPASFSPNGDGHNDTWRFATQLSRPLTSWTLTVRSPAGTIMRKLSGNGAAGSVVTTWDGRDTSGHRAPAGTYRWTLAGRGPAGQLRPLRGGTLTGQFTLSH